jgi:ornithine--oxo-acid transaminase
MPLDPPLPLGLRRAGDWRAWTRHATLARPSAQINDRNRIRAMPSQRTLELIESTARHAAANYAPLPVVISRGEGRWVYDVDGQRYLDCISAYSALNHGHCHPRLVAALTDQARRLTLTSRAVHNDRMAEFLEKLCQLSGYDLALPMNTGAEAVETAIKLARKWAYRVKGVPHDRAEIIVCDDNFHGRTTTIVGFSSEPQYREDFGPATPGFVRVPFGDVAALEAAITPCTAAVLVEPIQAEAGIHMPPDGYLSALRQCCDQHGVLLMLDEIQTGLGRTGRMFAYEHESAAKPDVLILGKALGGGLYPVSAVLAARELLGLFRPGDHGSTFGGNPLAAACGIAALEVLLEEALPRRAADTGAALMAAIAALDAPPIADVRGRGLLIGIEIRRECGTAREFAERLLAEHVLCKDTHSQVLRLAPALAIDEDEIAWLMQRLERVFCSRASSTASSA